MFNFTFTNKIVIKEAFNFSEYLNSLPKPSVTLIEVNTDNKEDVINNIIANIENTLIAEETSEFVKNNYVFAYINEGKPHYKLNETTNIIYAFPMNVYDNFGPRLIKKVPEEFFWRYRIEIKDNNTISFGIYGGGYSSVKFLNLTKPVCDFISLSKYLFSELYCFTTGWYKSPTFEIIKYAELGAIMLSGYAPNKIYKNTEFTLIQIPEDIKFSDSFAKNFPITILTKNVDNNSERSSNAKPVRLYKGLFSTYENFIQVVKSLVNAKYEICDEDGTIYNTESISNLITNKKESLTSDEIDENNKHKEDFITAQLTSATLKNFELLRSAILSDINTKSKLIYFKKLNSARTSSKKICKDTYIELLKDNNIDIMTYFLNYILNLENYNANDKDINFLIEYLIEALKNWNIEDLNLLISRIIPYLFGHIVGIEIPNKWNKPYDYAFIYFFSKKTYEYEYGRSEGSFPDISDIDFAVNSNYDLYFLYYALGLIISNITTFLPVNIKDHIIQKPEDTNIKVYKLSVIPEILEENIKKLFIDNYQTLKTNFNINSFNFSALNTVMTNIILSLCKKYKIKLIK